jgi:hypothetical protein
MTHRLPRRTHNDFYNSWQEDDLAALQRITDYIRLMREDLADDLDQCDEEDSELARVVPAEEEASRSIDRENAREINRDRSR